MKASKYLIILFLLTLFFRMNAQTDFDKGLQIEQVILPGGDVSVYFINDGFLTITNDGMIVLNKNLNPVISEKIKYLIKEMNIEKMDSKYVGGGIDGVNWTFTITSRSNKSKQIYFQNYFNYDLHQIINLINSEIPIEKRHISFEYGFFTNVNSKSDTLELILPDFYIEKIVPPKNYSSHRIICFKKGYGVSEDIDSILVCDCRIYPKKNSNRKIRTYWRYTKLGNGQWRKDIYDDDGKIIADYFVQETRPYKFVETKSFLDKSDRPSVTIYKYYKTEKVEK